MQKINRGHALGIVILTSLAIMLLAGCAGAEGSGMADFQTQGDEWVKSYNDSISSGIHLATGLYGISVFNLNVSDGSYSTVLGNITYTLDADNIVDFVDEEYAQRNGSFIHWVYPTDRVIVPGKGIYTTVTSGYYYSRYIPININRWYNKSIFNSDGYQLAKFNVTLENSTCDFIYGSIRTNENILANATFRATILPDTFSTDAPIQYLSEHTEHAIAVVLNKSLIDLNKTYNFSVIIKVNTTIINNSSTISAIEYKPEFSMSLVTQRHNVGDPGFTVTMPMDMLPDHVNHASASTNISTNWSYLSIFMRGMVLNELFNVINSTTPTLGTKGDVSGDGQVSVVDALFIAQYTVGTRTLTSTQLAAADVNGDDQVTIVDALFIAQYTVGLRQL